MNEYPRMSIEKDISRLPRRKELRRYKSTAYKREDTSTAWSKEYISQKPRSRRIMEILTTSKIAAVM